MNKYIFIQLLWQFVIYLKSNSYHNLKYVRPTYDDAASANGDATPTNDDAASAYDDGHAAPNDDGHAITSTSTHNYHKRRF